MFRIRSSLKNSASPVGRAFSLRTRFPAGPAGRKAGLRPELAAPHGGLLCCELLTHDPSFASHSETA